MKELKDIISLKANEIGGMAALAKKMNWGSGKNPTSAITKYVKGTMPGFDFAIQWKRTFNENLIELMFKDEMEETPIPTAEPVEEYGTLETLRELVKSKNQTIALLEADIARLKKDGKKNNRKKT
ncbi:hypothetical protein WSM22_03230 [Cytophagales bacterium WSM2-2]|nr:hypothetical protein WSM22_03230 [Cytophagales bacterium WSM2-2]